MELKKTNGSVVALGNFDGLHIGHMAVINGAENMAKRLNSTLVIATFKEHPLKFLTGTAPKELLFGSLKDSAFESTGAKVLELDFMSMKDMDPTVFFEDILLGNLNAKGICCGFNYSFGAGGKGNPDLLRELCSKNGVEFYAAPATILEGAPVSSTRIREAISSGEIELANKMLGRPFTYSLPVVDGDKRGRVFGTPTINQLLPLTMVEPKFGVYMSICLVDGIQYYGVTNVGIRPTVGGCSSSPVSSETYILDFTGDLYGKFVDVSLLKYIRPEIKFDNLDELKDQIKKDAETVRNLILK